MITPVKNHQDFYFINLFNMIVNRSGTEFDMNDEEIEKFAHGLNDNALLLKDKLRDEGQDPSIIEQEIIKQFYSFEGDYYLTEIKRLIQDDYPNWFNSMEGESIELSTICRRIKRYIISSIGENILTNKELGEIELLGFIQKFYEENVIQQKTGFRKQFGSN